MFVPNPTLQEWKAAYPEASLWGPQSTIKKRSDLSFRAALKESPPPEWLPDIDQAWFRGSFAMDEIVFLHRPSATAIIADLIQTFSDDFLREHWGMWRFLAPSMALPKTKPARVCGQLPAQTTTADSW